jgi:hypothetical protein
VTLAIGKTGRVIDVDGVENQVVGVKVEGVEISRLAIVVEEGSISAVGRGGSRKQIVAGQNSVIVEILLAEALCLV